MRVFVTHNAEDLDVYYGRALPQLQAIADVAVNPLHRDLTTDELIEAAAGCEVIVAHRSTPGDAVLFTALPDLVAFLRCAVDITTIDLDAASAAGVVVARADKSYVASTAELALGLLLDVSRNIAASTVDYRRGAHPPQRPGRQLAGATAGIIGYGSIGHHLAALLSAIGMRVLVHDTAVDDTAVDDTAVDDTAVDDTAVDDIAEPVVAVDLAGLLAESDVVLPLVPGTPDNENLIGAPELARMKPGAILVNVGRGRLLDEEAVVSALDSGRLGGVGLDVGRAPDERPSPELTRRSDVVATPHLGGLTPDSADAQATSSVEQVAAMLRGELPPRVVNPQAAHRLRAFWSR